MRIHSGLIEPGELVRLSTEALGRYKLRTFLSVLGVILGVAAVIAVMSVGEGARQEALAQIQGLGIDNLIVRNKASGRSGGVVSAVRAGDAEALASMVPSVKSTSPLVERFVRVGTSQSTTMSRVLGVRPSYQAILRLSAEQGRLLSVIDERESAAVCVLGATLSRALFGYANPVGQFVMIGARHYRVAGTIRSPVGDSPAGGAIAWRNVDEIALLPLSVVTGKSIGIVPDQPVDEIWLQVEPDADVDEIGLVVQHALARIHGEEASFDVVIPRELLAQRHRTQRVFSLVVGSVAAVALIIGGIGIMNIMLTSVVERTREIGVRRTVGATRRDIALQFVFEALLMTITGGALGILVGVASAEVITSFAGWVTKVSLLSIVLGFLVSFATGLTFGLYPALRAAALQPVDAMRYE